MPETLRRWLIRRGIDPFDALFGLVLVAMFFLPLVLLNYP